MLDISINLVIIAHVVVSLLLILVILMQRPKQEGLGAAFGSGMTDAAWGARTTDVLQKGTVYLGTLFFLLSLTLGILMGKQNSAKDFASDGASTVEGSGDAADDGDKPVLPTPPVEPVPPTPPVEPEVETPEDEVETPKPVETGDGAVEEQDTPTTETTSEDEPADPSGPTETPTESTPGE